MSGPAFSVWDGTTETTSQTYGWWDGASEAGAMVSYMPGGRTVTQLANGKPFVIAHRCGSADWAEHSMRGATQSVLLGVDGLEISVARTSDGVLFGLHDATLNRTTTAGLPANYTAADHTWAEISALLEVAPAGGDPAYGSQSYAKLTDLLAYASSHVIFIDPKVIPASGYGALLDLMDSYPNAKERFVGKYFGTGIAWADACRARGYKTWGYFYATDISAGTVTASLVSHWDYLGMEYNAGSSFWDSIKSWGKPVIAHIAPTLAAAQQGLANGAVGVMASGVRSVTAGLLA